MTKRIAELKHTICPACGLNSIEIDPALMFFPCLNQKCRGHVWDGTVGEMCYARDDVDNKPSRVYIISKGVLVVGEEVQLVEV